MLSHLGACSSEPQETEVVELNSDSAVSVPPDVGSTMDMDVVDSGLDAALVDASTADASPVDATPAADAQVWIPTPTLDMSVGQVNEVNGGGQCREGAAWAPGQPAFIERTEEWGLLGIGAKGTRITVADINSDGWPDLVTRRVGQRVDRFAEGEGSVRNHWVLLNRGGQFEDYTEASGFLAVRGEYPGGWGRPSEVIAFADIDNDGDVDAYSGLDSRSPVEVEVEGQPVVNVRERSELLINDGNGHFELAPMDHALRRGNREDVPSGAAWVDYDRDGYVDLWVSQGGLGAPMQDRLFRNLGDGQFEDVTAAAGLTTQEWQDLGDLNAGRAHTTAWGATVCDLNGDGWPELLASSYGRAPNHLWQSTFEGAGVSFANRSLASGYAYDDNFDWSGNQFARCFCISNPDEPGCMDVPRPDIRCQQQNWRHQYDREAFRLGGNSGATVCADLDGDGHLDLYTTEIRHWWAGVGSDASEILRNTGQDQVRFFRPGRAATGLTLPHTGASWDEGHITAGVIDFDNDGRTDIYLGATDYAGNRGRLYHNVSEAGSLQFNEMPTADFFEHNRSHGMGVGDFDRDGDLDLVVGHSRSRCQANSANNCYETRQVRVFENIAGNQNNWVQLDLRGGEGTNADAIGARVTVRTDSRVTVQEVGGGYGHFGAQRERVLHFGLGQSCAARVTVRWPNAAGDVEIFNLTAGSRYLLTQGQEPEVMSIDD